MNKTKATHVLRLSQEEYETLLWAFEELRATFDYRCEECVQGYPTQTHKRMHTQFDRLIARLTTETE